MRRIAVVTTTRAEYGLLLPLIRRLMEELTIELQVLVSGTHLLEKYGHTINQIINDGIPISYEIPILKEKEENNEETASKVVARASEQCGRIFSKERYDALIVLGDRYELLGFCAAAVICRIPIIHIHGGEITEGAIDDKIRHAITKMASIHFPSIKEYADRIIQMGENPEYVYAVGALGIDNISNLELLERTQLFHDLGICTNLPIAAVTYHPVTSKNPEIASVEIRQVLEALLDSNLFSVITMPNSDVGGDNIYNAIMQYVNQYPNRFILKKSLGQLRYLSLLKNADIMIGNSSSGIIESASFHLPTIDIGERQKGRIAPSNVVHTDCDKKEIERAIMYCLAGETRETFKKYGNPYGDGNTADRMISIIKKIDFKDESLICKHFFDIGR